MKKEDSPAKSDDGSKEGDAAEDKDDDAPADEDNSPLTKDRRTVFVSQLVMRADERDIRRYFRRSAGRVNDVILLRDRRTGRHKGCAYVELSRLADVPGAVGLSGQVPDFQRFPILVKASEAEKNYEATLAGGAGMLAAGGAGASALLQQQAIVQARAAAAAAAGDPAAAAAAIAASFAAGTQIVAQKVYVGSVDRAVTEAQLRALFSGFGDLEKVSLQTDPATGISRGFAFLSYRDPKAANLAVQTMSGQMLAGRAIEKNRHENKPTPTPHSLQWCGRRIRPHCPSPVAGAFAPHGRARECEAHSLCPQAVLEIHVTIFSPAGVHQDECLLLRCPRRMFALLTAFFRIH